MTLTSLTPPYTSLSPSNHIATRVIMGIVTVTVTVTVSLFCHCPSVPLYKNFNFEEQEAEEEGIMEVKNDAVKLSKSRFKRVCVFCGSSTGKRDCYRDAAIELAHELVILIKFRFSLVGFVWDFDLCVCVKVARRLDLVYGGGSIGLMGLVSQAVHRGGREVIG